MSEKKMCNLTFEEIKELIGLVAEKNLGKLEIKVQDCEIKVEGRKPMTVNYPKSADMPVPPMEMNMSVQNAAPIVTAAPAKAEVTEGNVVKSPIIGTYYASASPDKPPFTAVGKTVKKGDVLMIIESMKLMNEITSEFDGVVAEILVSNGEAVEYDQPIMIIK